MALLIGEFEQTIDAKHRLAVNMAIRELIDPQEDGENFIAMLGPDRHLWLYPDKLYRRLLESQPRSPLPDRHSRKIDLMYAMARLVKPDAQGRIVLPEKLMQRAVIADAVTLAGVYDHIEIWPTVEWERHVAETLPKYGDEIFDAAERDKADRQGS
jgi:MraZ protein